MKVSDKTLKLIGDSDCIGCKSCMKGCPMLNNFCDSPKVLLKKLLDTEEYDYILPYSCMLCGYCTIVCPAGVDFKNIFLELRRDTVNVYKGKLPKELGGRAVDFHQRFSFSTLFTSDIQNLQSDTIFFPGCALIAHSPSAVMNTYAYLTAKFPGLGIYNKCCGQPTALMGTEDKFKEYYGILAEEFTAKQVKRIITGCSNCFITLRQSSEDIQVVSLWEILAEIGIPEDKIQMGKNIDYRFTIHDPCPTRACDTIHEAFRYVITQMGIAAGEMQYNKRKTLCCGSGGMVALTQHHIAVAHRNKRAEQAASEYIITYCQECVESLRRAGKKTYHIIDLLFGDDVTQIQQNNQSTLVKWKHRLTMRKPIIKKKNNE